jgi:hypothetical protein
MHVVAILNLEMLKDTAILYSSSVTLFLPPPLSIGPAIQV